MTAVASAAYQAAVVSGQIQDDPAQRAVLARFDDMACALRESKPGWLGRRFAKSKTVPGIYLWGRVGRGKTFLTELFLQNLHDIPHQRWHFHRFMNDVHRQLAALSDTADTLSVLAKRLARDCRLLVLDEFFVSDIGDAMILYRLLEQLSAHGVSFVATSNVPPDELYLNGLQRASFLPCIALIKRECAVLELLSARDYRLRALTQAATFLVPGSAEQEAVLARQFQALSGQLPRPESMLINDRRISALALSSGVAWFGFQALCQGPRSAADYIEIARDFHTVLLSGVPHFDADSEDAARRFVYLIDELYDRHVNLLLTAAAEPAALYRGQRLQREFERTASRLIEMQSEAYLALEHRP
jgi:cell division protein ZapE